MRRNRRLLNVLFCTIAMLLGSILVPIPASATSAYDDAIRPVSSLRLKKNNSNLVDITSSYGYDIYNADATAYGHFHDCIFSSTCKYALLQEVSNANQLGKVFFIYAMDGIGSVSLDDSGPYGSSLATLSRPSGVFDYIGIRLQDTGSSTDRIVWEGSTGTFPVANTRPQSGACEDAGGPFPGYYCGITNDLGDQGIQPFLSTFPVNYPSGYEGEEIPTQAAHAKYVAMGDSFSSGEGNEPFEAGTAYGGINECHRSPVAYPRLLQADTNLNLGSTAFVACSGATTYSVLYGNSGTGNWDEGPQVDALSEDTEVVTITVGGNDVKFKEFAEACFWNSCAPASNAYADSYDVLTNDLPANLEDTYQAIADQLTSANTGAVVYVIGYPYLLTSDGYLANKAENPGNCTYIGGTEAVAVETLVTDLNDAIETAVDNFNDSRFVYVDPNASHDVEDELCSDTNHFNGVDGAHPVYSFHPNSLGHIDFASIVSNEIG